MDESYTRDRYYTAALLVPRLPGDLSDPRPGWSGNAAQAYGVAPSAEVHGTDLLHGSRGWEPIKKMPRIRIGV
ncbi:hypothetical protein AB0B54_34585 [Microbispora bryophytorum]|uniref:hypothetical protein n=1 Tax=Microbispora bryophytorum TaxID=1460882 RepID=UPI00340CB4C7